MTNQKSLLFSPILQFLLIGAVLFALNFWLNSDDNKATDIVLQNDELESFAEMAKNNGILDTSIFKKLVEKRVNQELVFQYGLSLNLHQSNSEIKDQIAANAQKIIKAQASLADPGDSVLNEYLNQNAQRFKEQELYDFEQYFYTDLLQAQQALFTANTGNIITNGDSINIPNFFFFASPNIINQTFGVLFKDSLIDRNTGWRGIIKSNWGYHVITNYYKKKMDLNLKQHRVEIYHKWKKDEQLKYYNSFILKLKQQSNVLVNSENYQFISEQ